MPPPKQASRASRERFEGVLEFFSDEAAAGLTHDELEDRLSVEGRGLIRQLLQDHLDLRAQKEERLGEVVDAKGTPVAPWRPTTTGL